MISYISKRIAVGIGLLFLVFTLIFSALHLVPGDPAVLLLSSGEGAAPTQEAIDRVREQLGLNLPLWQQYLNFFAGIFTGDLGSSFQSGIPVAQSIAERLPRTFELIIFATLIAVVVGVPLGALAARKGGIMDSIVTVFSSIGVALPVFVFGLLLMYLFSLELNWLPAGGFVSWEQDAERHFKLLILPAITLAVGFASTVARMTRSSVLEMMNQDWVRTATSRGLARGIVFRKHVLRNSLTPVLTVVGIGFGTLLGSTVLVERVFNYPGLSSLLVDSVLNRDYPVIQGIVVIIAVLFIAINIIVDVFYGLLDPRVRR